MTISDGLVWVTTFSYVTVIASGLTCTGWLQQKHSCSFTRASVTHLFLVQSPHRDWFYLQMPCSVVNECFVVSFTVGEWEFIYSVLVECLPGIVKSLA